MDVAVRTVRLPKPGETLLAESISAAAAGRAPTRPSPRSAPVARRPRWSVPSARTPTSDLADLGGGDGIDGGIRRLDDHPTGVALITIDADAENTIIVAAGANAAVTLSDADRAALGTADVVLAQLEGRQRLVADAAARDATAPLRPQRCPRRPAEPRARRAGRRPRRQRAGAVDLAPAADLEAAPCGSCWRPFRRCWSRWAQTALGCCVVTDGPGGGRSAHHRPDTVAAGDTFCGVYAAGLAGVSTTGPVSNGPAPGASLAVHALGWRPGLRPGRGEGSTHTARCTAHAWLTKNARPGLGFRVLRVAGQV